MLARIFTWLANVLIGRITRRPPDFVIGSEKDPYLLRWFVTPWRRWTNDAESNPTRWNRAKRWIGRRLPNIYLHHFLRDDDDRALHDHPWLWCSILLRGGYIEHTIAAGGIHHRQRRSAPSIKFSLPSRAHRIELLPDWRCTPSPAHALDAQPRGTVWTMPRLPCWTLFITGPVVREWGFHCPERGWVHWREFTDPNNTGLVGPGCGGEIVPTTPIFVGLDLASGPDTTVYHHRRAPAPQEEQDRRDAERWRRIRPLLSGPYVNPLFHALDKTVSIFSGRRIEESVIDQAVDAMTQGPSNGG